MLYGAAHRRPWQKGKEYSHLQKAEGPGDLVSVDQLVSSVPGFIAQEQANVRYKLTRRRFKAATVFVDHYSRLSYVHVHTSKQIAVEKVDTKYQRADIMTKALPKDSFQFLRKTITGW